MPTVSMSLLFLSIHIRVYRLNELILMTTVGAIKMPVITSLTTNVRHDKDALAFRSVRGDVKLQVNYFY